MNFTTRKIILVLCDILAWPITLPLTIGMTIARFIKAAYDYGGSFIDYVVALLIGIKCVILYQLPGEISSLGKILMCSTDEELDEILDEARDVAEKFYFGDED